MTSPVRKTPRAHHVFNAFDEHGVTLGLKRLKEERNAAYKCRLLDVMVHRAGPTYLGLVHGITRELGLSIFDAIQVTCKTDSEGQFLLDNPAIVFDGNLCTLISDASPDNFTIYQEIDRYDPRGDAFTLSGLVGVINATAYFEAELADGVDPFARSMMIHNQTTAGIISSEDISTAANRIKLANENIVSGSLAVFSPNLFEQVSSEIELVKAGQYYVDLDAGTILCYESPVPGSLVRYIYLEESQVITASPVILHDLQQDPFRKKLFDRAYDVLGEEYDGPPSLKGIDIINELYGVVPTYWGT